MSENTLRPRRVEEKLKNKTAPNKLPVQAGDLPALSPVAQLDVDLAAIEREGLRLINPYHLRYGTANVYDIGLALAGRPELKALRERFDAVDRPATAEEIAYAVGNRYVNRLNLQDHLDKSAVAAGLCNLFAELKVTRFALERTADELFRKGVWLPSPEVEKAIKRQRGKAGWYREMLKYAEREEKPAFKPPRFRYGSWEHPDGGWMAEDEAREMLAAAERDGGGDE